MRTLRTDFTEQDMIAAIRSKCSDVKKQMSIQQKKRNQVPVLESDTSQQSFANLKLNMTNGNGSHSNHTYPEEYTNGVKREKACGYTRNEISLIDDSSSEYFQDME